MRLASRLAPGDLTIRPMPDGWRVSQDNSSTCCGASERRANFAWLARQGPNLSYFMESAARCRNSQFSLTSVPYNASRNAVELPYSSHALTLSHSMYNLEPLLSALGTFQLTPIYTQARKRSDARQHCALPAGVHTCSYAMVYLRLPPHRKLRCESPCLPSLSPPSTVLLRDTCAAAQERPPSKFLAIHSRNARAPACRSDTSAEPPACICSIMCHLKADLISPF